MLIGVYETLRIVQLPSGLLRMLVYPLTFLFYYFFASKYYGEAFLYDLNLSLILGILLLAIISITLFYFKDELFTLSGKFCFSLLYPLLGFGYALGLIDFISDSKISLEAFWLFVLIWSSDSFAYFSGRLFGKHKMAPTISPKKTWEGFAGGVILTLLLSYFIHTKADTLNGNWMVVGLLVAIFAPLGDLVESQLKRLFGVKDSGNIIPGHGGILDRLDSFIICAPVVYLYFIFDNLIN